MAGLARGACLADSHHWYGALCLHTDAACDANGRRLEHTRWWLAGHSQLRGLYGRRFTRRADRKPRMAPPLVWLGFVACGDWHRGHGVIKPRPLVGFGPIFRRSSRCGRYVAGHRLGDELVDQNRTAGRVGLALHGHRRRRGGVCLGGSLVFRTGLDMAGALGGLWCHRLAVCGGRLALAASRTRYSRIGLSHCPVASLLVLAHDAGLFLLWGWLCCQRHVYGRHRGSGAHSRRVRCLGLVGHGFGGRAIRLFMGPYCAPSWRVARAHRRLYRPNRQRRVAGGIRPLDRRLVSRRPVRRHRDRHCQHDLGVCR